MSKAIGEHIFKKLPKIFKYYVLLWDQTEDDFDANKILAVKIIPLIRKLFREEHDDWVQQKIEHGKERKRLEEQALGEVKEKFQELKQRLLKASLLDNAAIKFLVSDIEKTLEGRDQWVMPSYLWSTYEDLVRLCEVLLSLGLKRLVRDYVKVVNVKRYQINSKIFERWFCFDCKYLYDDQTAPRNIDGQAIAFRKLDPEWVCPKCNGSQDEFFPIYHPDYSTIITVPIIHSVIFAPSIHLLANLNDILARDSRSKKNNEHVWVDWENVYSIEWGWNLTRYFFRDKELGYDDPKACARSANLLELHSLRCEMKAIKEKQPGKSTAFFSERDHVRKNLYSVLNALSKSSKYVSNKTYNGMLPYAIELMIEYKTLLRLVVEWEPGLFEVFHMHLFQDFDPQDNVIYSFIVALLDNPGALVTIPLDANGNNATKYLERVGIEGVIDQIFVLKKTALGAKIRATRVVFTKKSEAILVLLREHLQRLETVKIYRARRKD